MRFVLVLILGLPIFIAPQCWDIYPRCVLEQVSFNMYVHTSLLILIPLSLVNFKINLNGKFLINFGIFSIYLIICAFKNSLYALVLLLSLAPLVFDWDWLNIFPSRLNYKIFLYASAVGAITSLVVYLVVGGDQYLASLLLYSYLNYWNDYIILLWLISYACYGISNKKIGCLKMEFLSVLLLIAGAVLLSASRASIVFLIFVFIGFARDLKLNKFYYFATVIFSVLLLINDDRLYEKFQSVLYGDPFSGRGDIWEMGLSLWSENPIFGVSDVDISSLHSVWVDIFVLFGLSGVFLIVFAVTSVARVVSISRHKTLSLGLIGFFLGPFSFNVPLRQLNILFALLILTSLVLSARRNSCAHAK